MIHQMKNQSCLGLAATDGIFIEHGQLGQLSLEVVSVTNIFL